MEDLKKANVSLDLDEPAKLFVNGKFIGSFSKLSFDGGINIQHDEILELTVKGDFDPLPGREYELVIREKPSSEVG